jgi:hypothetical protein
MTANSWPVGVVLATALSACATVHRSPAGGAGDLVVHVENNMAPPGAVDVWLLPQGGDERALGSTPATSAKIWRLRDMRTTARYRLMARREDSATVISRPFDLGPLEVVRWDIALNVVETAPLQRGSDPFMELFAPPPREVAGARIASAASGTSTTGSAGKMERVPAGR